jgi:hypothetical protein
MHAAVLIGLVVLDACGAASTQPMPANKAAVPASRVTSPCVFDNGYAKSEATRSATGMMVSTAECGQLASCVVHPLGPTTPGDGDISLSCRQTHCQCHYVPHIGDEQVTTFDSDKPCGDTDIAKHLLITRCGVEIAPDQ